MIPSTGIEGYLFTICKNSWITASKRNKKVIYTEENIESDVNEENRLTTIMTKPKPYSKRREMPYNGNNSNAIINDNCG